MNLQNSRLFAAASFATNFACQIYGSVTHPNLKEIADANHYAFSPHPYFIGAFFSMQTVLQLYWLSKFWTSPSLAAEGKVKLAINEDDGDVDSSNKITASSVDDESHLAYAPIYALGNFCIGQWRL